MIYVNYEYSILNNLWIVELTILFFTILCVTQKNTIISVLFLITIFLGVAIYMLILGLSFIGLSYLLVYVGAVSIIFLFILMLIDIRISELYDNITNQNLFLIISITFIYFNFLFNYNNNNIIYNYSINFPIYNVWDGALIENYDIVSIGNILYTNTSIWLIISLLTLLLAMIGSIKINIISQIS